MMTTLGLDNQCINDPDIASLYQHSLALSAKIRVDFYIKYDKTWAS